MASSKGPPQRLLHPEGRSNIQTNAVSIEPRPILVPLQRLELGEPRVGANDHSNTTHEDGVRMTIRRAATKQHVVGWALEQLLLFEDHLARGLVVEDQAVPGR